MSKKRQIKFLDLYKPIHDRFEKFCRARAYADMPYEDLMNETLLLAYNKMDVLRKEASFLSFLIGISLRILANSRKKKRAITSDDLLLLKNYSDQQPNQQNVIEKKFEVELLHKALSFLPEKQREAIILFEITGFSIKEIMEIQKSKESAVKQRLVRGRKELARIVNQMFSVKKEGTK